MAGRNPARFLAPLALVAFALALFVVISSTAGDSPDGEKAASPGRSAQATPKPDAKPGKRKRRRTYEVRTGDTPSGIAAKFDISLDALFEANPELDPQTLTPGTKLKLPR